MKVCSDIEGSSLNLGTIKKFNIIYLWKLNEWTQLISRFLGWGQHKKWVILKCIIVLKIYSKLPETVDSSHSVNPLPSSVVISGSKLKQIKKGY